MSRAQLHDEICIQKMEKGEAMTSSGSRASQELSQVGQRRTSSKMTIGHGRRAPPEGGMSRPQLTEDMCIFTCMKHASTSVSRPPLAILSQFQGVPRITPPERATVSHDYAVTYIQLSSQDCS